MSEQHKIDDLELKGGKPCLDFVNTVGWRISPQPVEWLGNYDDLVRWSRRAGILTDKQLTRLLILERQRPEEAQQVYQRAIQWREALHRLFLAVIGRGVVEETDLALLNQEYTTALAQQRIVPTQGGFALTWPDAGQLLSLPLWQIAKEAGEILTSVAVERIHLCAGSECSWLFFDQSKNRSRKWCDSQDCGNRDRVRRYYHQSRTKTR